MLRARKTLIIVGNPQTNKVKPMLNKIKINNLLLYVAMSLVVVGFVIYSMFNIVPESNVGVFAQKNTMSVLAPGAHFMKPFSKVALVSIAQRVNVVSGIEGSDAALMSNVSVLWQVGDVNKFWQATGNDDGKINALFKAALTSTKNFTSIQQNADLSNAGIKVNQVLLTGQMLSDAQLQATYQKMQGLANTIAQNILATGTKNAEAVRAEGDQALIDIEGQAASQAAQIIGAGQTEAVQMNAPLYHKNPSLFKLLVDTKAKIAQQ